MSTYSGAVTDAEGGALLRVRVTPRSKVTRLDGVHGNAARIRVAAPPADGKANAVALAFLASALGVRQRDLSIVRGRRARTKTVQVAGVGAASVASRLESTGG